MAEEKKAKKINPRRTPVREQDPGKRKKNFEEVSLGYAPEEAVLEAARCLGCKNRPCVAGCPVGVPVPEFIAAMMNGDFAGAYSIIRGANVLPAVCGRVCPQENQCEGACTLGKKHEPVAIGRLERFCADWQRENGVQAQPETAAPTGMKVAVVGSGPSGITCAYDLARMGHEVTMFEALHEPGGVLFYGIPQFRLPKEIVAGEINTLRQMGVRIMTNSVAGKLITLEELMEQFDACFIGVGAGLPRFMSIPGEDLNGVYSANEFLTRTNLMRAYRFPEYDTPIKAGRRVAVIGGGNVAMDAARTAMRLGADEVTLVYRRSEAELPARAEEVHHGKEEGLRFEMCTLPTRITGVDGWVKGLECVRMELCEMDQSGRRRPNPVAGSEFEIPLDTVIMAIGTGANPLLTGTASGLALRRGYIEADPETGKTSLEGVYAGGDIVTGAATVISAMGAGRKAARAMHEYLSQKAKKAKTRK